LRLAEIFRRQKPNQGESLQCHIGDYKVNQAQLTCQWKNAEEGSNEGREILV